MDNILHRVKDFAEKAHGTQRRKYRDEAYIVHLVNVMEITRQYEPSLPVLSAALLHDVLEDTSTGRNEIHDLLASVMSPSDADKTVQLVVELTDVYTKPKYRQWNRRKRKQKEAARLAQASAEAQTIKYADILDNCRDIVKADPDFAGVFLRECKALLERMQNGNASLRQRAIDAVNNELALLQNTFI